MIKVKVNEIDRLYYILKGVLCRREAFAPDKQDR